jgi:hypothetical protein
VRNLLIIRGRSNPFVKGSIKGIASASHPDNFVENSFDSVLSKAHLPMAIISGVHYQPKGINILAF